ncbi:hypothetical protein ACFPM7_00990 [Actinokineospora guangxiensis]|uniref:Uncharacterized protein n=1 Tax=Actinokineospora guangxiensis TaxID=1490288 RepID=A0ABW0EH43_9PSEU
MSAYGEVLPGLLVCLALVAGVLACNTGNRVTTPLNACCSRTSSC